MGTHSSDFISIARQHPRILPVRPVDTRQCADAENDVSDGGGKGFMLFLMAIALSALLWWLL